MVLAMPTTSPSPPAGPPPRLGRRSPRSSASGARRCFAACSGVARTPPSSGSSTPIRRVGRAPEEQGAGLPPISVAPVGDVYAIRDGHHRVSVAHGRGAVRDQRDRELKRSRLRRARRGRSTGTAHQRARRRPSFSSPSRSLPPAALLRVSPISPLGRLALLLSAEDVSRRRRPLTRRRRSACIDTAAYHRPTNGPRSTSPSAAGGVGNVAKLST